MSDSIQPPRSHRIRDRILLALFCLALLGWFVWLAMNMSSHNSLLDYERQWEAKGEHFAFTDFIPKPVPDDQNFALTPVVASSYDWKLTKTGQVITNSSDDTSLSNRLEMDIYAPPIFLANPTNVTDWSVGARTSLKALQTYYRALAAKTNIFPVAPQPQSPAADVLLALSKHDQTIEELRQAAALPDSRFPLNYNNDFPAEILLPHLAGLKRTCVVLELRAVAKLQNGQSDLALADIKLALRLIESTRGEPFLISHLVRISMLHLTLQPVWEGLQDHHWSDAQLAELDKELARLNFLADYEFSMRGERALAIADIEYLRHSRDPNAFTGDYDSEPAPAITKAAFHLVPKSVFFQNELFVARAFQEWILPVVDVPQHRVSPEAMALAETNIDEARVHWSFNKIFADMLLSSFEGACRRFAYAQNEVDLARVACALESFRLAHGKYPETLADLSPEYLESIPTDVISGQPLKYHRNADETFTLYSVGWNEKDDGGVISFEGNSKTLINSYEGDWVWPNQSISQH